MNGKAIVVVSLLSALAASAADGLELAVRGAAADRSIVIPAQATPVERHAAEELAAFLLQMTDVRLPVVTDAEALPARAILVGETRHTAGVLKDASFDGKKLGEDGFRLAVRGPHLVICGSTLRGALYGVYTLLEDYADCRWYASWCSVIPRRERVCVPAGLDIVQKPAFDMRRTTWRDLYLHDDLAVRLKLTPRGDARYGGDTFRFGKGLGSCHTFHRLLPVEKYGKEHPEYYSMVNGRRLTRGTQLCLTNPDVLRLATRHVLECIRRDPGAKFYGVSQNDLYNYCTCPKCAAVDAEEESHAGTNVRFVNAIAEAVEKEFPDVLIETLAYQYTRKPPKITKLRHNVVPCLCTFECDFANSIPGSPFRQNAEFCSDIVGWSKQTSRLYLWDYTVNFHNYPAPFANVPTLQENIRFFRDHGVKHLFEQGNDRGRHGYFAELKGWLLAKWMWNPEADRETLLKDFLGGYYGKGAPYVRAILDETHARQRKWSAQASHPLRIYDSVFNGALPDEFLRKTAELWSRALDAVKDDPVRSYNVRMSAFSTDYTLFERMRLRPDDCILWMAPGPVIPRPDNRATVRRLQDSLEARMAESKDSVLHELPGCNRRRLAEWKDVAKRLAEPVRRLEATPDCGIVKAGDFRLESEGTYVSRVDDAQAVDGKALKFHNTHYNWCALVDFKRIHFQPGRKYRISVRARVEKQGEGRAFWCGVYNWERRKGWLQIEPRTSRTPNEYRWYEVGVIEPHPDDQFWFGPGRFDMAGGASSAVKGVFVDQLKFEALKD